MAPLTIFAALFCTFSIISRAWIDQLSHTILAYSTLDDMKAKYSVYYTDVILSFSLIIINACFPAKSSSNHQYSTLRYTPKPWGEDLGILTRNQLVPCDPRWCHRFPPSQSLGTILGSIYLAKNLDLYHGRMSCHLTAIAARNAAKKLAVCIEEVLLDISCIIWKQVARGIDRLPRFVPSCPLNPTPILINI